MRSSDFKIKISKLPKKAHKSSDFIDKMLRYSFIMGYEVGSVDYNVGLIQFKKSNIKINWYTTKNTIVLIEYGVPKGLKRQTHDQIWKLICKHSKQ